MKTVIKQIAVVNFLFFMMVAEVFAADSYRWLRVTIDTPWAIFIFLLPMVLFPAVLMAVLYWRFSGKKEQS